MTALDKKGRPIFVGDYVKVYGTLYKVVHANTGSENVKMWIESIDIHVRDTTAFSNSAIKVDPEDVLAMKLRNEI